MKIPNSVIYVVGDVLGNWYYSHTKLDTLFEGNGFTGAPPERQKREQIYIRKSTSRNSLVLSESDTQTVVKHACYGW